MIAQNAFNVQQQLLCLESDDDCSRLLVCLDNALNDNYLERMRFWLNLAKAVTLVDFRADTRPKDGLKEITQYKRRDILQTEGACCFYNHMF